MGASCKAREGGTRALVRSEFLFPSLEFLCGFLLLAIFFFNFFLLPLHFSSSFRGLDVLKKVGALWKEALRLEAEAQHLESCGLEKMEVAVAGSEVEGFYGLLRGAMLHSSISLAPSLPRKPVTHHLPPSPIHPLRSPKNSKLLVLLNKHWNQPL